MRKKLLFACLFALSLMLLYVVVTGMGTNHYTEDFTSKDVEEIQEQAAREALGAIEDEGRTIDEEGEEETMEEEEEEVVE